MTIIKSLSLVCSIALCFALLPPLHAVENNVLINKTNQTGLISRACEFAEEKDFCMSSLKAEPASHDPDTDLGALGVIAIKVAQANGTATLDVINKKLSESEANPLDPVTEQCLEDCQEHYESAVEQLDNALGALTLKKLTESKVMVSAAMTDADSCEDGFKQGIRNSVLAHRSGQFQKICEVAMAVLKGIEKDSAGKQV